MTEYHCRWAGSESPRMLRDQHVDECPELTWHPPLAWVHCDGCAPCHRRHCGSCGHRHVADRTCPECVGEARADLLTIRDLEPRAYGEAVHRGVNSEAAHLAGPTANPEAHRQRRRYGYRDGGEVRTKAGGIVGENHPLWVLGTWDLMVTEHYNHRRTARVTVASAAAYLAANLTELAQDEDFAFEDLASDLRSCRGHLEDVLRDGEQIETGAPCLTCRVPMTKSTDDAGKVTYECTKCRRTDTEQQYRYAVGVAHRAHADRLSAADLADRIGVPASTVRRWASVRRETTSPRIVNGLHVPGETIEQPPLLRSCGTDSVGRKVYRVEDAEELRDKLRTTA